MNFFSFNSPLRQYFFCTSPAPISFLMVRPVVLRTYTGEALEVSDETQCHVIYRDKHYSLPVVVVDYSAKVTLLGKNWLRPIKLAWREILSVSNENLITAEGQLSSLPLKYRELFTESYEGMKGLEAHITMKVM